MARSESGWGVNGRARRVGKLLAEVSLVAYFACRLARCALPLVGREGVGRKIVSDPS